MIQIMGQTVKPLKDFSTYECTQYLKKEMPVDGPQKYVVQFCFITEIWYCFSLCISRINVKIFSFQAY